MILHFHPLFVYSTRTDPTLTENVDIHGGPGGLAHAVTGRAHVLTLSLEIDIIDNIDNNIDITRAGPQPGGRYYIISSDSCRIF